MRKLHFRAECCKKYRLPILKNASNINTTELNFLQKLSGRISLFTAGMELGTPKTCIFKNIIMH